MADTRDTANELAANKLGLLANLFSAPGDLILEERDKAGLVEIFHDVIRELVTQANA